MCQTLQREREGAGREQGPTQTVSNLWQKVNGDLRPPLPPPPVPGLPEAAGNIVRWK